MTWLYRLQARANLTTAEATALVVLAVALGGGTVARHVVAGAAPPPAALYAAADAAFVAADVRASGTPEVPLLPAVADSAATVPEAAPADSLSPATAAFVAHVHEVPHDEGPDAFAEPAAVAERAVRASASRSRSGRKQPAPTNINTASEAQLAQGLPRVGPAIAARIVEHRRTNGRFRRAEDIQEVRGIGPKTFEQMAPYIRL